MVLMKGLVHRKKMFIIDFSKAQTRFCLSLHNNYNNSYLFVNGKKSLSLKLIIKMLIFQLSFV